MMMLHVQDMHGWFETNSIAKITKSNHKDRLNKEKREENIFSQNHPYQRTEKEQVGSDSRSQEKNHMQKHTLPKGSISVLRRRNF